MVNKGLNGGWKSGFDCSTVLQNTFNAAEGRMDERKWVCEIDIPDSSEFMWFYGIGNKTSFIK